MRAMAAVKSAHVWRMESRSLRLSSRLDSKTPVIEVPKTPTATPASAINASAMPSVKQIRLLSGSQAFL
jgi:hypothetical protein